MRDGGSGPLLGKEGASPALPPPTLRGARCRRWQGPPAVHPPLCLSVMLTRAGRGASRPPSPPRGFDCWGSAIPSKRIPGWLAQPLTPKALGALGMGGHLWAALGAVPPERSLVRTSAATSSSSPPHVPFSIPSWGSLALDPKPTPSAPPPIFLPCTVGTGRLRHGMGPGVDTDMRHMGAQVCNLLIV